MGCLIACPGILDHQNRSVMRIRGKIGIGEELVDLSIEAGRIAQISAASPSQKVDFGDQDLRIAPGLIDIQINGYDGVDFNNPKTGAEEIAETAKRLLATGVTSFCPTLITNSADNISKCISRLMSRCRSRYNAS